MKNCLHNVAKKIFSGSFS